MTGNEQRITKMEEKIKKGIEKEINMIKKRKNLTLNLAQGVDQEIKIKKKSKIIINNFRINLIF